MDEENQNQNKGPSFESLDILISRWKDGTFGEIIDDWKWIFSYSARYKGAIVFLYYPRNFQYVYGSCQQCCQQVYDRYYYGT